PLLVLRPQPSAHRLPPPPHPNRLPHLPGTRPPPSNQHGGALRRPALPINQAPSRALLERPNSLPMKPNRPSSQDGRPPGRWVDSHHPPHRLPRIPPSTLPALACDAQGGNDGHRPTPRRFEAENDSEAAYAGKVYGPAHDALDLGGVQRVDLAAVDPCARHRDRPARARGRIDSQHYAGPWAGRG